MVTKRLEHTIGISVRRVTVASAVAATAVLACLGAIFWMGYAKQWALISVGVAIGFLLSGVLRGGSSD
ncbi:MAG: hypothetical protein WDA07_06260 [Leucobacter sp.]